MINYYDLTTENFPNELLNIRYIKGNSLYNREYRNQTELLTFTIDPSSCKDQDDAISIDIINNKIYIHIVDIESPFTINSLNDIDALKYAYTLYLHNINNGCEKPFTQPRNQGLSGLMCRSSNGEPEHRAINILPNQLAEEQLTLTTGLAKGGNIRVKL